MSYKIAMSFAKSDDNPVRVFDLAGYLTLMTADSQSELLEGRCHERYRLKWKLLYRGHIIVILYSLPGVAPLLYFLQRTHYFIQHSYERMGDPLGVRD